jgi:hypothetical protein
MRAANSKLRLRSFRPASQYETGKVNAAKARLYQEYIVMEISFFCGVVPDKDETNQRVEKEHDVLFYRH